MLVAIDGGTFDTMSEVWPIEDIDGDGTDDLITGIPQDDEVRIYSGVNGETLLQVFWPTDSSFGFWANDAGDFDGDGTPDFIAGAPLDWTTGEDKGAAAVCSGVDGSVLATFYGQFPQEEFGYQVAGIGDVDSNGYDDVAVASHYHRRVRIYGGPDGHLIRFHEKEHGNRRPSIASIGDVTQDGVPDYVIGWPTDDSGGLVQSGTVVLFSGRGGTPVYEAYGPTGLSGDGPTTGSALGLSVAGVGDVDGDGFPDFVAGAPGKYERITGPAPTQASVFVYSGKGGHALLQWDGEVETGFTSGVYFGWHVAGGGDINGDGVPDILVGALVDAGSQRGTVSAYSCRTRERLWRFVGGDIIARMYHGAILDDVDGDGLADFAAADPEADSGGQSAGRITVYAGAPGDLERVCTADPLGAHGTLHLDTFGALGIGNNFLSLRCADAPPDGLALFVYGPPSPRLPMQGGWLCTGPPSYMLGSPQQIDANGFIELPLDFTQLPLSGGPSQVLPGSTWSFQLYARDAAGTGLGPRLSDALAITFPP